VLGGHFVYRLLRTAEEYAFDGKLRSGSPKALVPGADPAKPEARHHLGPVRPVVKALSAPEG
jgi:hypothetical protein